MSKYKRIVLGRKISETAKPVNENGTIYPSFYVSNKKLPLKGSDVGKMMDVSAKIKFTGIREENRKGNEEFSYDFEVREITF